VDMLKKILLLFLLLSTSNLLFSQITISSPVIRQIFQRDLNNQATVTITGSYSQPVDTIQVRFLAVTTGQGTTMDWTVIKSSPLGGLFKGSVNLKGGWYSMEVRGLLNGKLIGNVSTISRVGVGEVFVIAGQSNAGGSSLLGINETAANDDRVNCANFISPRTYYDGLPFFHADLSQFSIIEFSQLKKTSAIGPTGLGPYYWGKVGDALAAKLNVPIMFFNAGWAGASVRVWRESAENPTVGALSDFQFDASNNNRYPIGYPYSNLSTVLRYYGINLGIRAVLWMEGETQNLINLEAISQGKTPPITTENYLDNLRRLVKRTRQDLGTNKLAWVVARTSYSGQLNCAQPNATPPAPSPIIVTAQNQAITDPTLAPMYAGPFTDNIQIAKIGERDQCVHFTGKGLDDVAAAWVKSLTEDNKSFFETVEPILADTIPSVSLECISNTQLRLTLPTGYKSYTWFNATTQKSDTTRIFVGGSGTYSARVTRTNGNIIQVPNFTVNANAPARSPIVTATSDVNFCLGTSVLLQGSTEAENPIYEWTSSPAIANLPRTKDISASREATYKLRVIDRNACASAYSADIKLVAKPRPEKPTIATSGSTEFCEGQTIVLTSSNAGASSYLWKRNKENIIENTQVIVVKKMGNYSVQTRAANGCLSDSSDNNISVRVNPLPATPQIRALADTVFCEGGSVTLVSTPGDNSTKFGWNRNNVDDKTAIISTIKVSGTELVKSFVTDSKNCNSNLSNAIQVVKKDNPKAITIIQKTPYALFASSEKPSNKYIWKLNSNILSLEDSSYINTRKAANGEGSYTVVGKNIYKIRSSSNDLICFSSESLPYTYSYEISENKGFIIYPNPSNGYFFLDRLNFITEPEFIEIFTIDGKLVYSQIYKNFLVPGTLDLSSLATGKYILRAGKNREISKMLSIYR
jgi:hypothetical protein